MSDKLITYLTAAAVLFLLWERFGKKKLVATAQIAQVAKSTEPQTLDDLEAQFPD